MLKLKFPTLLSRLNIRIGTKLAVTVGIGVVLVAGMMLNQQISNASVAQQAELERNEQFVTADMLRGGVALQGCRSARAKYACRFPSGKPMKRSPDYARTWATQSVISSPRRNSAGKLKIARGSR